MFQMFKWAIRSHFKHLSSKSFLMIKRTSQSIEFWPLKLLFEILRVHRDSISQSKSCLGSVRVHSLTLSYTFGSMWCDSWAFSWPTPLQPLCFGREPKARVMTPMHPKATTFHTKGSVLLLYGSSYILGPIFMALSSLCVSTTSLSSGWWPMTSLLVS
jgi:hypothetical protein